MKINKEKLTDYLDGLAVVKKKETLVVGMILINEENKKDILSELKCFGYKTGTINTEGFKKNIKSLENILSGGFKIALKFEDEAVALFMTSLKRIIIETGENPSNNKSIILLVFTDSQYQKSDGNGIIHSVCNLI